MKRLRKIGHAALVWISVCLLLVDPAAACKFRNRRCCCCCECLPAACDSPAPAQNMTVENLPIENSSPIAPSPAVTDAAPLPTAPVAISPGVLTTQPLSIERTAPHSPATPGFADHASPTPLNISPARPNEPRIVEPSIAAPAPTAANRQPAALNAPATTEVAPPAIATDNRPVDAFSLSPKSPLPADLQQRQPSASAITSAPSTASAGVTAPTAAGPVTSAPPSNAKRSNEFTPMPTTGSRLVNPPKPLAAPGSSAATSPVIPPAFPPVADDPFAPPAGAAAKPQASQTHDDDPFAPLQPAAPADAKPAAPIATEPTLKRLDPLAPGADGQLPTRQWSDNSGQFQVQARLLLILDGKVRLLKETGRTTTVPMDRLSDTDRAYVEQVISRYGKDLSKLGELAAG